MEFSKMTKEADYSYEGNVNLRKDELNSKLVSGPQIPIKVDIKSVKFLVPVEITFEVINTITEELVGEEIQVQGGIDFKNQEVSLDSKIPPQVRDLVKVAVFEKMQSENGFYPENHFEASDEVYDQADRAKQEHEELQGSSYIGDM